MSWTIIKKNKTMDKVLTEKEEKFCLVYASGPAPFRGNAQKCYALVFNGNSGMYGADNEQNVHDALNGRQLMMREDIKARIDELSSYEIVNASTLRPRLTETLLRIVDECSTKTYTDKFGREISPAAPRSVAVNAVSKLIEMYGIKEDIAHKIAIENSDGSGITFNVIMPEKKTPGEDLIG